MLPSHYADPAGNQVAIPDANALINLIRTKVISGQTWVLTDEHTDWVSLSSLPEWPQWLAAAEPPVAPLTPLPDLQPRMPEPLRWPLKAGWLLLGLALLTHFGLFYYTRGHFTGEDFFEEAGALVFVVAISWRIGHMIQQRSDGARAGQRPLLQGISLLTMAIGLSLVVTVMGISTWQTYQAKGAAGLAFEDSLRGVDDTLKVWATQMNAEYNAIWDELDLKTAELDVKGLDEKPETIFASVQAAKDGERRAREAALLYQSTAKKLRSFVTATNSRLQTLKITADLRAKQQKAWNEEFAPGYLAEVDFLAAKGESMTALADLLAVSGDLMAKGEVTWNGSKIQAQSEAADAKLDQVFDHLSAKHAEEDRLYKVMVDKNS